MKGTFAPTNEWLYQHIVEDSGTAVMYGDAEGVVRLWNRGAEEIFGWTAEEALGRQWISSSPKNTVTRTTKAIAM
jgi:PAS domain S-box-containing protein